MKKLIIWIILFVIVISPATGTFFQTFENPFDYARITDVDYKAVVVDEPGCEGKIVITERLTFDVHAASKNDPFWELWRDLPERWVDGVYVDYKVNSVKQILDDGTEQVWYESYKLYWDDKDFEKGPGKWYHSKGPYSEYDRQYECLLFYVDGIYRDKITFEIEYEMSNAVLRYADCTDLYIAMWSGSSIRHLNSFDAEILIPNNKMPQKSNYSIVSYGTNKEPFKIKESATKNDGYYTFYFNLDKSDLDFTIYNEYIEVDMVVTGSDKHIFSQYASENDYYYKNVRNEILRTQREYFEEVESVRLNRYICIMLCTVVLLAFAGVTIYEYKKIFSDKYVNSKRIKSLYRQIPSNLDPKFAAAFIRIKHRKKEDDASVYAAVLLSLARKGYVELEDSGKDMMIKILHKSSYLEPDPISKDLTEQQLEELTYSEKHYLELIQRHAVKNTVMMSYLQKRIVKDYDYTNSFVEKMNEVFDKCGYQLNYFENPSKKHVNSMNYIKEGAQICSFFALAAYVLCQYTYYADVSPACLVTSVALMALYTLIEFTCYKYIRLTPQGAAEYEKWCGLYNFLKSDTLMNERTVIELPLWEKYLVYATAFGISEKVIKAIKVRCPEMPEQTIEGKSIVYKRSYRTRNFTTHSRGFSSHVSRGSHRATSYSSGGFSGGYRGGGGRGGGGGGGGH